MTHSIARETVLAAVQVDSTRYIWSRPAAMCIGENMLGFIETGRTVIVLNANAG